MRIRGRLPLTLEGQQVTVLGGPFDALPAGTFSVCLEPLAVKAWLADISLPIPDFGVPELPALKDAVGQALTALVTEPERPLFVGCRAGLGRTGLFLACLARAAGVEGDPVAHVRAHYHPQAVETPAQQEMAQGFTWP